MSHAYKSNIAALSYTSYTVYDRMWNTCRQATSTLYMRPRTTQNMLPHNTYEVATVQNCCCTKQTKLQQPETAVAPNTRNCNSSKLLLRQPQTFATDKNCCCTMHNTYDTAPTQCTQHRIYYETYINWLWMLYDLLTNVTSFLSGCKFVWLVQQQFWS